MKITFHPTNGRAVKATLPYTECRFVVVKGDCPVCHGKNVYIAHDIHETAIFEDKDRKVAIAHLKDRGADVGTLCVSSHQLPRHRCTPEGGPMVDEMVPSTPGEWKIAGINARIGDYTADADAVCQRCRSHVGRLHTEFNTLFGRREDNLVLSGRYGTVIGG